MLSSPPSPPLFSDLPVRHGRFIIAEKPAAAAEITTPVSALFSALKFWRRRGHRVNDVYRCVSRRSLHKRAQCTAKARFQCFSSFKRSLLFVPASVFKKRYSCFVRCKLAYKVFVAFILILDEFTERRTASSSLVIVPFTFTTTVITEINAPISVTAPATVSQPIFSLPLTAPSSAVRRTEKRPHSAAVPNAVV